jgi:hypothetical protein
VEKPFSLGLVEQIVREMAGAGAAHGAEATKVAR